MSINKKKIFVTGNTIADAIKSIKNKLKFINKKAGSNHMLLTIHRKKILKIF